MCYDNAQEIELLVNDWCDLFPDGAPCTYMPLERRIGMSLLDTKRGIVKKFLREVECSDAELAKKRASCHKKGVFPLLNALLNKATLFPLDQ